MKKFLFAFAAAALFAAPFFSLEVPQLESPVMDLAGIMTQKGRADLQEYLLAIDQNSAAQIAVLTIPKDQAVPMAHKLAQCGIKAIWNFAHVDLDVPNNIQVENVHLSDSLMKLSYNISRYEKTIKQ